jgi:hypothetical protein
MTSKKHRRSRRRRADEKNGPYAVRHPFSGIDRNIIREAALKMAEAGQAAFPDLLKTLIDIFKRCFPPHILATLAAYGLSTGVSEEGVADRALTAKIEQHHVELLQALLLTLPSDQWGEEPATPGDIQTVIDSVNELGEAFHHRRLLVIKDEHDDQQKTVLGLQERMRLHTQIVRNWGYLSDVIAISEELYAPLDEALRDFHGFGATDLIRVARAQLSIIEERGNQRFRLLKRIFRERTIKRLVRDFFRQYPGARGDPEEYIRHIPSYATTEMVRMQLLTHADKQLVSIYLVSADELAKVTGIEVDVARRVMAALTLYPGCLQDRELEHLFLDNPVWRSPIIGIGGEYFCVVPMDVFSFIHDVLTGLLEMANLKTALEKRRAIYLEDKTEQVLRRALPRAEIVRNAKWWVGAVDYETDLVARIDRTAVIAEAKSAALSAPALRGAPERVKRHIRDLIADPSEQSARLEGLIRQANDGDAEAKATLSTIGIDFTGVEQIVRISVTLDEFSVLSSSEGSLKDAGWILKSLELAPTFNIADLACVVDILDAPGYFIHYLVERERFQKAVEVVADEMDFLGFYLMTGFNVAGFEEAGHSLTMTGMSLAIDRYYNGREAGVDLPKPVPRLRAYFRSLVESIQKQAFPGWTTVTVDLLSVASYEEQKRLDEALVTIRSGVERNWRDPGHQCSVAILPPPVRETTVIFYAFPPQLADNGRETARNLASNMLEETGKARCVVIARNITQWDYPPYAFVYVARRGTPRHHFNSS